MIPVESSCLDTASHSSEQNISGASGVLTVFCAALSLPLLSLQRRFRDVEDMCERLSGALQGTAVHLDSHTLSCTTPTPSSAADWMSAAMWLEENHCTRDSARSGLFSLGECPQTPQVFVISGSGSTLASGTLQLQRSACIVLDGTCSDVELRDVVVKGALSPPSSV